MKAVTLFFMITSGVLIFTGIYMLAATMCFWTVQGLEVANIFTDGGREMAQYPLNIYQKWVHVSSLCHPLWDRKLFRCCLF
jgi:ABC-2 type transport system permease protein